MSSRSSSNDSLDLPKRRKKSGRRKLDEVERLAEMERQRRQKEAEQKVYLRKNTIFMMKNANAYSNLFNISFNRQLKTKRQGELNFW